MKEVLVRLNCKAGFKRSRPKAEQAQSEAGSKRSRLQVKLQVLKSVWCGDEKLSCRSETRTAQAKLAGRRRWVGEAAHTLAVKMEAFEQKKYLATSGKMQEQRED